MSAREHVDAVVRAALAAADPREAVRRALRLEGQVLHAGDRALDLGPAGRLWLVGAGKAARGMAEGALAVLGERVAGGSVTVPRGGGPELPGLDLWEARHPLPDAHGLAGAAEALRVARRAGADDVVLCLLSGGASALWAAPADGVSLEDLRAVTDALLRAGVPIGEVNVVRRHLSRVAGGQLARAAAPARVATLAISDVLGAPAEAIGSGPTAPDPTTYADALEVLRRRGIQVPAAARRHLQAGAAGEVAETAKPGELDGRCSFHVVARLADALDAAGREARRLGYAVTVVSDRLEGEARGTGTEIARAALRARNGDGTPRALLWGGETTVTVRGAGRGGRCQELALAAARVLDGEPGVTVAALGTDGVDGPTDAAGAVVDGETIGRGRAAGRDPDAALRDNDSYTFLRAAGDLLVTGPTGTNVNDLVLALLRT